MRPAQVVTDQRGFALLAVTLVLALLGVAVTEFAFSMRLEAAMVRSYKDAVLARHLAEAGIQQAIRKILIRDAEAKNPSSKDPSDKSPTGRDGASKG